MPETERPDSRSSTGGSGPASVRCPQCATPLPAGELETHLRRLHQIHQFRGVRRSHDDTWMALVLALSGPRPDAEAWATLEAIAGEDGGEQADAFLTASISQTLARTDPDARAGVAAGAAAALVAFGSGRRLLPLWVAGDDPADRELALQVAAALVQSTGTEGAGAEEVFRTLIAGMSKTQAVERLRELSRLIGPSASLERLAAGLEDRVRMACPRCSVRLRRREMVRHLWDEHRLVLEGRRVREPWGMVEEWLDEYRRTRDANLLERSRVLAQRADEDQGPVRLQQLVLAHRIDDAEARKALLAEAAQRRSSLCPHCFAFVPVPEEVPLRPLNVWRGRLSQHGYRVEVLDRGLFARLEIVTPDRVLYRGREPGRLLTRQGAYLVLAGPVVVAAVLAALGVLLPDWPPLTSVLVLLGAALGVALGVRSLWRKLAPPADRAVNYAWRRLVPPLCARGLSREQSAVVAGLALTSLTRGSSAARASVLADAVAGMEKAVSAGQAPVEHLADLRRLVASEATAAGKDAAALVAAQVKRCFDGRLPLVYAERLLAGREDDAWFRGNRGRLRVLVCDRAFEAGFEVRDLVGAGRVAPTLGAVLETDDSHRLGCLRLLWSLRPRRPWDHCGPSAIVFDLAATEGGAYQARYRDLLLAQEIALPRALGEAEGEGLDATILLCCRGVLFQETMFREPPERIEVVSKQRRSRRGFEVVLGGERFWFRKDPDVVVSRLERWFRYFFNDFSPQLAAVRSWESPSVAANLRARETVPCPGCGRAVLTRAGKVGVSLDDGEAGT